nr:uncharacterized protein LOC131790490 [Pocillopora verrucosa]
MNGPEFGNSGVFVMFCSHCGIGDAQESICDNCVAEKDVNEVIKRYFHCGYPYDAIVGLLKKREGLQMCVRTLKRRLRCLGLKRKGNAKIMDDSEIRNVIREEMEGPGSLSAYRSIWHALRLRHHVHVPRNLVAKIMKEIDLDGVEERRSRRLKRRTFSSKGANASWHFDGYDKLKPYGFPIHGAVDGFSRRILWLEVTRSNNDPKVVAAFYLKQVKELGGYPLLLVTDCGSENGIAASIQCMFRTIMIKMNCQLLQDDLDKVKIIGIVKRFPSLHIVLFMGYQMLCTSYQNIIDMKNV